MYISNMLFQLFVDRPVWSKNALKCQVDLSPEQFKVCLPPIAYYFITGPWRSLWVKLGYDPRKDPSAKQYQLLDFRVRQSKSILHQQTHEISLNFHLLPPSPPILYEYLHYLKFSDFLT